MQANPLDAFVSLVSQRASWDQHDRDMATWSLWLEVRQNMGAYLPAKEPAPSHQIGELSKLELSEARALLHDSDNSKIAFAFGQWRAVVTEHEARNAGRLMALAQLVQALTAARLRASKPEAVDQALAQLGEFIARQWRTDVPLGGDVRTWSSRITRRPDLLPFVWREI
jgi:hypothetical protein